MKPDFSSLSKPQRTKFPTFVRVDDPIDSHWEFLGFYPTRKDALEAFHKQYPGKSDIAIIKATRCLIIDDKEVEV